MRPNPQETADLVTFTEEILSGKLHVLCSDGPIIWSLVPQEVRYTDSLEKFKNKIRSWKPNYCPCRICKIYILNIGFLEIFE